MANNYSPLQKKAPHLRRLSSYHTIHGLFLHFSVFLNDVLDVRGGQTAIDLAVHEADGSQTAGSVYLILIDFH